MPKKTRKRFTPQEKAAILRLHLLEHIPVSDLCDQHSVRCGPGPLLEPLQGVRPDRSCRRGAFEQERAG